MNLNIFVLALGLATVNSIGAPWWRQNEKPFLKRDVESSAASSAAAAASDVKDLFSMAHAMLTDVKKGMPMEDLVEAASNIQQEADKIVNSRGDTVEETAVQAVLDTTVSSYDGKIVTSALFGSPLNLDASKLDAAFCLMRDLTALAERQEESNTPSTATLAAISQTAQAIIDVLDEVKADVFAAAETEDIVPVEKRSLNTYQPLLSEKRSVEMARAKRGFFSLFIKW